jgi:hypothetical protein
MEGPIRTRLDHLARKRMLARTPTHMAVATTTLALTQRGPVVDLVGSQAAASALRPPRAGAREAGRPGRRFGPK